MEELLHIADVVQEYISGDWGEDSKTDDSLVEVACVRGADINNVNASNFDSLPIRYISKAVLDKKCLREGDIVIEKSGGAPTQSTGRVAYISKDCKKAHDNIVCSNFCAAFSVKPEWNARFIFYYLQYFYTTGVFFNFEGKTSGLHNLQIEQAFKSIPIKKIPISEQKKAATILSMIDQKIALNRQINRNLLVRSLRAAA
jgi:type I restriction enzyme S subunit